jgi:hypothetical protein
MIASPPTKLKKESRAILINSLHDSKSPSSIGEPFPDQKLLAMKLFTFLFLIEGAV